MGINNLKEQENKRNVLISTLKILLLVGIVAVSYTHLRAHETGRNLVCRLLLEKKKKAT